MPITRTLGLHGVGFWPFHLVHFENSGAVGVYHFAKFVPYGTLTARVIPFNKI